MFEEGYSTKAGAHWGLGLSIVRRVVERCGGSIRVTPAEPSGLTVTMRFPLVEPGRSGLALVVAADDTTRRLMTDALSNVGFSVLAGADALEACDLVAGRDVVDIAFIDSASATDRGLWDLARLADVPRRAPLDAAVADADEADQLVTACVASTLVPPDAVDAALAHLSHVIP
jgi:CheY-like chemotaxis protein